jgi:hypothetical protein
MWRLLAGNISISAGVVRVESLKAEIVGRLEVLLSLRERTAAAVACEFDGKATFGR